MTTTATATIYEHMFRSFGLNENPFHVSPDPRFLFSGPAYETALAELMFGIESHRGLLVLTGEAGTGKTTLMRHFLQWLNERQFSSCYIFHTHLDPADLFEVILRDFGVPVESTKKSDLLATLHRWLHARQSEGDSPVIIIDEAQALSLRTLSELNLLLNLENTRGKLLQIVLAGQPELEEKLRRAELRSLRQRIMVRCRLPLLSLEETGEYIASRLRGAGGTGALTFPAETVRTIYSYARGIPRVVNLLCEHALIGAYADRQPVVSPGNVRRVAAEFDLAGEPFSGSTFNSHFALKAPVAGTAAETHMPIAAPVVPQVATMAAASAIAEAILTAADMATNAAPAAMTVAEIPAAPALHLVANAEGVVAAPPAVNVAGMRLQEAAAAAPIYRATLLPEEPPAPPVIHIRVPRPTFAAGATFLDVHAARAVNISVDPVAPGESREATSYAGWRKRRSPSPFQLYWQSVVESFVRDWRGFFASLAPQMATLPKIALSRTEALRRSVIHPVRNWLVKPIPIRHAHVARTAVRTARAGKS